MRRPSNVTFRDGTVMSAGALASSSAGGNKFGIEVSAADHVRFDHVKVVSSASRGFDVSHGATYISLTDSTIDDSGDDAINMIDASHISVARDKVSSAAGYGTYLAEISDFQASDLTLRNVSTRPYGANLHRAFWLDHPAGDITLNFLRIVDDQPRATGYVVGCSQLGGHRFSITTLTSLIRVGKLQVDCAADLGRPAF